MGGVLSASQRRYYSGAAAAVCVSNNGNSDVTGLASSDVCLRLAPSFSRPLWCSSGGNRLTGSVRLGD